MNSQRIRGYLFTLILLAAVSMLVYACGPRAANQTLPTPTQAKDLPDLIKTFENAYNQHDVQGLMALLTNDATYDEINWGVSDSTLKDIQKRHEFYFGQNYKIYLSDCKASSGSVTCKMAESDDCVSASGINLYRGEALFMLQNNKIRGYQWTNDNSDDQNQFYTFLVEKYLPWMQIHYATDYGQLMGPDSGLSYDLGVRTGKECHEFAATLKKQ